MLLGSSSPPTKAQFAFLGWPGPISSQVGGSPKSGVYINPEARNKDESDPGEKDSLLTSIFNFSTPAERSTFKYRGAIVHPGAVSFARPLAEFVSGGREKCRVQNWTRGDCVSVQRLEDAAEMRLGS